MRTLSAATPCLLFAACLQPSYMMKRVSGQSLGSLVSPSPPSSSSSSSSSLPYYPPLVNRTAIPNPFGDGQPPCDLPVHDMAAYFGKHGKSLPDHPAVFRSPGRTFPALGKFRSFGNFLEQYAEEEVTTEPGYAQAGGHLSLLFPQSRMGWRGRLGELARLWNDTLQGHYHSEFNCGVKRGTSLCRKFAADMGDPVPDFAKAAQYAAQRSAAAATGGGERGGERGGEHDAHGDSGATSFHMVNFLVGGPGSGLPFHRHSETWQTMVTGRKAWYIVPPGRMTDGLAVRRRLSLSLSLSLLLMTSYH